MNTETIWVYAIDLNSNSPDQPVYFGCNDKEVAEKSRDPKTDGPVLAFTRLID